jgi:hypothetical protein
VTPAIIWSIAAAARLVIAAAAALVLTCGAEASLPQSGRYGVVRKGPIAPVCRVGEQCDAPAQVTLVFSRSGRDVARATSSREGRYRVALAAGYYAVHTLERIGIGRNIRPANVHVRAGHVDRIDFSIDTGIR